MLFSCVKEKSPNRYEITKTHPIEIVAPEFQSLLDSAKINGSILIYDISKNTYHSNNFDWARKGKLPASTFKIPNSIIGLELGIVENDSTLFKWDGQTRSIKNWNQDLIFRDAFKYSCVPCYQDLARRIGAEDMSKYVDKLEYGNIQFEESNLDIFWLEGASRISQIQQLDFLNRLYTSQLPISKRTETIVKKMMVLEKNENYILSGKTGWSISNRENNGWFVGWLETQSATYLFATNVDPSTQFNMKEFPRIRKKITMQAFQQMNIIPKN
jgi:beta-lactamase class D